MPLQKYTCKLKVNFWNWISFILVENENVNINRETQLEKAVSYKSLNLSLGEAD